jgi:hypothetical protein
MPVYRQAVAAIAQLSFCNAQLRCSPPDKEQHQQQQTHTVNLTPADQQTAQQRNKLTGDYLGLHTFSH